MPVSPINSTQATTEVANTNQVAARTQTAQPSTPEQVSAAGVTPRDGDLAASLMRTQLATIAGTTAPTTTPALNPRGTFQAPVNNFLTNTFRVPASAFNQTSLAVNSANQLQSAQLTFDQGGSITMFLGLPPSNPFPPQTTAQIPRVVLDPAGVLSFARNMTPLTDAQRSAIQNLYAVDQVSRGNYAANVQNLASALTAIKNACGSNAVADALINKTIGTLRGAYAQLANFKAPSPDPDTLYKAVATTLDRLPALGFRNQDLLNDARNILGIGYSNYLLNRLPINGANNPTATTRGPLAAFNPDAPLADAQANPAKVFGAGLTKYLNSIGIFGVNPAAVNYQVNSANAIQAATVALGNGQNMTLLFSGAFPPTNANPPQIAFSGTRGARQFADIARNDPATQQRLSAFFTANAAPRAAYVTNLNNLIAGFQALQRSPVPAVRLVANDSVARLQAAVRGLNAANPIIPNVLGLYQTIGDNLDAITANFSDLTSTERAALDTLNRSTYPIGLINYFARPVVLSQPATT